jgi:hypothetical protein
VENKLIEIYLLVCHLYDMHKELHLQANRNGQDTLTVPELMTIYLFGQLNGHFKSRHIYNFIKDYWHSCFPALPSYQAFNRRLNLAENHFHALFDFLLSDLHHKSGAETFDYLIDSMPIMLAKGSRSKRARVAPEIAKCGFSAVKQTNFHGVRLHLIAEKQSHRLPLPARMWITEGNVHDLTALKENIYELPSGINLFGDKAYADTKVKIELENRRINLLTPMKKPKKKELSKDQKNFNKTVSTFRQPIESFFKWLIDKTDIQRASQVRSTEGLLIHCVGKLTFALLLLNFYY